MSPKIQIYSTRLCGYCKAAERIFSNKGFEYELVKVDEEPEQLQYMQKITGLMTVPQIFIDDQHIGGFDDLSELEQSGELEVLLYSA